MKRKNGREDVRERNKGKETRRVKGDVGKRLGTDIHTVSIKYSLQVSPVDPSCAVGTGFSGCGFQASSSRTWEFVRNADPLTNPTPHPRRAARHPESEKLGRGPAWVFKGSPSLRTTAIGHSARTQTVFRDGLEVWRHLFIFIRNSTSHLRAFSCSHRGQSWFTETVFSGQETGFVDVIWNSPRKAEPPFPGPHAEIQILYAGS